MTARCHCGRFLADVKVEVVALAGYGGGYAAGNAIGRCAVHGDAESIEPLGWEEAFGDWDPEARP